MPTRSILKPPANVDIAVDVVFAQPQRGIVKRFRLAEPTTVAAVLALARAEPEFAGIDFANPSVGVFGRVVALTHVLADGDRIEIYRPLSADPKLARRTRAREARRLTSKSGRF